MTLTSAQKTNLNNSNEAHRQAAVGTLLGGLEAGTSGVYVKAEETVTYDQFTDGGAAVGTYETSITIPQGAVFQVAVLSPALTGFAGDTSATIQVGDGTDVDRYNTGTPDVFSDVAGGIPLGVPSGTAYHATAKTITITITSGADWGSVSAGALTLTVYYFA